MWVSLRTARVSGIVLIVDPACTGDLKVDSPRKPFGDGVSGFYCAIVPIGGIGHWPTHGIMAHVAPSGVPLLQRTIRENALTRHQPLVPPSRRGF